MAVINPAVHGVLFLGEKGTCKTTLVRSLSTLLPETQVIDLTVLSDSRSTGSLAEPNVSASLALIRKFVHQAVVINPVPIADRFARTFASSTGAKRIDTE